MIYDNTNQRYVKDNVKNRRRLNKKIKLAPDQKFNAQIQILKLGNTIHLKVEDLIERFDTLQQAFSTITSLASNDT